MQFTILLASSLVMAVASLNQGHATPLSFPPSQYWDGNDGQWSSFHVSVGSPSQRVRLLPGTSATAGDATWVVLSEGCSLANPGLQGCEDTRGNVFTRNESTSWSTNRLDNQGLYQLDTYEESKLGLTGNAYYGFDTLQLGSEGSELPDFTDQIIAGIATNDFWLGSLGLSPLPINFTSYDSPIPSLLTRLRNSSYIPSTSWGYTAGAVYKDPPTFGSLTFGGYDAERIHNTGISLPFWTDQSRDLLVGLQSITYDTLGSVPLMTDGIYTFIDSVVAPMWLPLEACQAFERAFGLVWNETADLYLLDSTTHADMRAQNPTFTLTLGSGTSGGNTTTINLPYSAFDLNMTVGYTSEPYFPLKRAQNSTQYTLGRVFLQEAYVIADYDRRSFTVAQAAFPASGQQKLVSILPPGFVMPRKSRLNKGAVAGVAVGAAVIISLLSIFLFIYIRRRRPSSVVQFAADQVDVHAHLHDGDAGIHEKPAGIDGMRHSETPAGADGMPRHEMLGSDTFPPELPAVDKYGYSELQVSERSWRAELSAGDKHKSRVATTVYELPAGDVAAAELESAASSKAKKRDKPKK
nr:hypothetical protein B0A51_09411 [Rachicladosporium sp. CCFEE 5018]